MQKSRSGGDSDEGWGLELGKAENFMFIMAIGFVPAYSVTDGFLNKNSMSLI